MNYALWKEGEPRISKWQQDFVFNRFDDDLAIAQTAISAGKTAALAMWIVLQCCKKPGIRGIIVAQTYKALTKVLISEIEGFCSYSHIPYKFNQGSMEIHFDNGSKLFAYSAENPNAVLGLSEISLLAIDEAAYCKEEIYNYSRDRMRGGKYKPMVRLISSPCTLDRVENWFSTIVKKYPDKVVRATYLDNPFTEPSFKKELEERYVIGSNLFRQQCLGEIFDADVASQIIMRNQFPSSKYNSDNTFYMGIDCAGLGNDKDMFTIIDKYGMIEYKELQVGDIFQKSTIATELFDKYKVKMCNIDGTGGYGQGLYDLLQSKSYTSSMINFAQAAYNKELYPNCRTEMYLELAKAVKNGFWVNDEVKEELLAQSVFINNKGNQQLVPKEEVKKILGHSPDLCDSVALALYAMNHNAVDVQKQYNDALKKYLHLMGH